jgi:hypothetical protein
MAEVSIKDSGIPRLYRTVWLQSEVGPDSGTLASRLAASLGGFSQGSDVGPSHWQVYQTTVTDALERVRRGEITNDAANQIELDAWETYKVTLEEEAAQIENDAYDFYLEMERIAFERHQLPGTTDRVKPEEFDAYERERDAAYAVYEEALATAQEMRDEASEHARKDRVLVVSAQPQWIWPALLVGGIGGLGIWALWKGKRGRA